MIRQDGFQRESRIHMASGEQPAEVAVAPLVGGEQGQPGQRRARRRRIRHEAQGAFEFGILNSEF